MTTIDNAPPSVSFETKRILITPRLAEATMAMNTNNRTLTPARVNEFVSLMKTGRFQCTHQGIALDENGTVIDGQHRLAAIVKSKCSVYMLVSKGVSPETIVAVDTGKTRTALAISKITGHSYTNPHFAIARILQYGPVKAPQAHIPPIVLFDMVDKFSEGINFALSSGNRIHATILSVVARASYTKDRSRLSQFMSVYLAGVSTSESDVAAAKLKMFMLEKQRVTGLGGNAVVDQRLLIYRNTESALTDFLNRYPTKKIMPSKTEKFPLPSDFDGWTG